MLWIVVRVARFGCLMFAWSFRILLALVIAGVLPALCGLAVLVVVSIIVCVVTGGDRWTQEAYTYPFIITGLLLFGAGWLPGMVLGRRLADYLLLTRRRIDRAQANTPDAEAAARERFHP